MATKSKRGVKARAVKVRTVKKRIINNNKNKGVKYTVEPLEAKTHNRTIKGDIFKKYINGVLVKQVFVSKNKLINLIGSLKKSFGLKVGGNPRQGEEYRQPQQIEISDKTTLGQNVKSGFGMGFGLAFAFNLVEVIFNSIFGE